MQLSYIIDRLLCVLFYVCLLQVSLFAVWNNWLDCFECSCDAVKKKTVKIGISILCVICEHCVQKKVNSYTMFNKSVKSE